MLQKIVRVYSDISDSEIEKYCKATWLGNTNYDKFISKQYFLLFQQNKKIIETRRIN